MRSMGSLVQRNVRSVVVAAALGAVMMMPLGVAATHEFSDVPATNIFHDDISWLADNGITTGCGDGTAFCPGDPVTRQQMAAFMRRLAEKKVVNADTAEDAAMLGSRSPAHYESIIKGAQGEDLESIVVNSTLSSYETLALVAPQPGVVLVTFQASVLHDGFDDAVRFGIELGAICDASTNDTFAYGSVAGAITHDTVSGSAVFQVPAGTTTFRLCGQAETESMLLIGHGMQLTYSAVGSAPAIATSARTQSGFGG